MKVFIVNLKESTDRRKYMIEEMKKTNLQYEFFSAVDGRKIKNLNEVYDENLSLKKIDKQMTAGEIGCALSHLSIYKKMIDDNIERALILEDDIIFNKDFNIVWEKLIQIPIENSVILLGQSDSKVLKKIYSKKINKTHKLKKIFNSGYGTFAYLIDRSAAEKIYNVNNPVIYQADRWSVFCKFIKIYIVLPYLVDYDDNINLSVIDGIEIRNIKTEKKQKLLIYILFRKAFSLCKKIIRNIKNFIFRFMP